ncbi:hypothetical protein CVT24_002700 [Panaeolus cyanescens]|uniref:Uncharacterized protein n=1 Tax=Panaeolus cyanescens TaxID=181874 RepID=A0A409YYE8_9AGAR|nr:hypothetical protein CVT24_002700 [Panaeolus cyanescens]
MAMATENFLQGYSSTAQSMQVVQDCFSDHDDSSLFAGKNTCKENYDILEGLDMVLHDEPEKEFRVVKAVDHNVEFKFRIFGTLSASCPSNGSSDRKTSNEVYGNMLRENYTIHVPRAASQMMKTMYDRQMWALHLLIRRVAMASNLLSMIYHHPGSPIPLLSDPQTMQTPHIVFNILGPGIYKVPNLSALREIEYIEGDPISTDDDPHFPRSVVFDLDQHPIQNWRAFQIYQDNVVSVMEGSLRFSGVYGRVLHSRGARCLQPPFIFIIDVQESTHGMVVPEVFENKEYLSTFTLYGNVLPRGLKMNTHGSYLSGASNELEDAYVHFILHPCNPLMGPGMREKEEQFLETFEEIDEMIAEDEPNDWCLLHRDGIHPTIHLCRNLFQVRKSVDVRVRRSSRLHTVNDAWILRPDFQAQLDQTLETYNLNPLPVFNVNMEPYPPVFLQSRLPEAEVEVEFDLSRICYPPPLYYPEGSVGRTSTIDEDDLGSFSVTGVVSSDPQWMTPFGTYDNECIPLENACYFLSLAPCNPSKNLTHASYCDHFNAVAHHIRQLKNRTSNIRWPTENPGFVDQSLHFTACYTQSYFISSQGSHNHPYRAWPVRRSVSMAWNNVCNTHDFNAMPVYSEGQLCTDPRKWRDALAGSLVEVKFRIGVLTYHQPGHAGESYEMTLWSLITFSFRHTAMDKIDATLIPQSLRGALEEPVSENPNQLHTIVGRASTLSTYLGATGFVEDPQSSGNLNEAQYILTVVSPHTGQKETFDSQIIQQAAELFHREVNSLKSMHRKMSREKNAEFLLVDEGGSVGVRLRRLVFERRTPNCVLKELSPDDPMQTWPVPAAFAEELQAISASMIPANMVVTDVHGQQIDPQHIPRAVHGKLLQATYLIRYIPSPDEQDIKKQGVLFLGILNSIQLLE